ncbi:hypothetical protein VBM87_02370 [Mycoplasma sp. 744]|uniref:hypothetical protein n=1 Tax=Mycoplasma sp. 744 TaxID=3108531 RepID=UPI002B1E8515|nr:hypothetical protein [Mycoplasma sp. 744]MEA4115616.1 hypothetical protein [Mycoplasma sp. 744]
MDKLKFKKLNKDEEININGGSIIATATALAPIIFNGINTIASVIKMFSSSTGEYKTKDNSFKWDNKANKTEVKTLYYYY